LAFHNQQAGQLYKSTVVQQISKKPPENEALCSVPPDDSSYSPFQEGVFHAILAAFCADIIIYRLRSIFQGL
jgi:ABC-type xylose transport system substrate-binding protein